MSKGGNTNFKVLSQNEIQELSVNDLTAELEKATAYCDLLIAEADKRCRIENIKGLPTPNTPIRFKDKKEKWHNGVYLKEEDMFFIGFEDSGDFRFQFEVLDWEYMEKPSTITKNNK